jgi:tetratricopeptide (TPR) repeat protein
MRKAILALCLTIAFANLNVNAIVFAEAPAQTVQSLVAEARAAQSRRDFNAAAESYRKATALDPSIPELWANLGLMYHEAGKSTEAMQSFREAIRLNPSLFVPQLFLGIEYLESKNPKEAILCLEKAEKLNPKDLQTALSLGKAYAMLYQGDEAAEFFWKSIQLAPNNGDAWLALGTSYLQQVESDARLMTSTYGHSEYVNLRGAEIFAEEGKLVQAEDAYKTALASPSPAPCAHAELGITLLRRKKIPQAREQFALEERTSSHCGLAPLGLAVAELAEGHLDIALKGLTSIATPDSGFVRSSLPLFRGAVSTEQAKSLVALARTRQANSGPSVNVGSLIESAFLSDDTSATMSPGEEGRRPDMGSPTPANAEQFYAAGQYTRCSEVLRPALRTIGSAQLQILASCSFYTNDFRTASIAAQRLKADPATRLQGLYWESKADAKLAITALSRAGEIDADSPRMHVLLGDVFRQKRRWDDAEAEYRKAIALDPKSHAARLSLAIVLFIKLKNDDAFDLDRSLLAEDPSDPEANLLAGEILVQWNLFSEAEPYLTKCTNLKPEFLPRLHVLFGKVYGATDRIPAAITEFKLGLSTDEDGSIHFQLGRLYEKSGDKSAADQAFRESKRIRSQWDDRARVALEQSSTDISRQ